MRRFLQYRHHTMELNLTYERIKDLQAREAALRGYL